MKGHFSHFISYDYDDVGHTRMVAPASHAP